MNPVVWVKAISVFLRLTYSDPTGGRGGGGIGQKLVRHRKTIEKGRALRVKTIPWYFQITIILGRQTAFT